ncbi:O-antigen ligase family protein [Brumimicrobium aurantiacum]|nr:O-antigen ligase family protein [Brumimicrobium aurantiacum]
MKQLYRFIYVYYFLLSLLMVSSYYYVLNGVSILLSIFCIIKINTLSKKKSFFILNYLLLFLILVFNIFFIDHQETAARAWISMLKDTTTAILPALFINDIYKLKNALIAIVLGGIINTAINLSGGIGALQTGGRYIPEEIMLSLNSFGHASLIYLLCTLLLIKIINKSKWNFILGLIALGILLSLLIIGSRQTFVAFAAFYATIMIFKLKIFNFSSYLKLAGALIAVYLLIDLTIEYYPNAPLVNRFINNEDEDGSRFGIYEMVWDLFLHNPLTGYGLGTFKFYSYYVYTHSVYLEILFTGGLIYALCYFLFYFIFLKRNIFVIKYAENKSLKIVYTYVFALTIALLVNGFFFLINYSRLALSLQFLLINFILITKRKFQNSNKWKNQ